MSFICFLGGSFLVACMTVLEIIDGFNGNLWQYFIIASFFFLSGVFFCYANIEIVKFDKESKKFTVTKWVLCYNWKIKNIDLEDGVDINLVLSGANQKFSSTLYYKIKIITRNAKPVGVLETKDRKKVIDKALKIRAFFNMKGKIVLEDLSTEE